MNKLDVCVVGATGLVGRTFLKVLEEYNFPVGRIKLLASARSKGVELEFCGKSYAVEELTKDSFAGYDLALFSAGASVSEKFAPYAKKAGLTVIDNSSCFRNDDTKPLVVPEVNLEDVTMDKIIANPNCSTIQCMLPLKAIDDKYNLKRVVFTTYQAVSGSGQKGVRSLKEALNGNNDGFYPYDISKTCIPHIDVFLDNDYTKEEMKMVNETRKILHKRDLKISATCVRVPVLNSHAVNIMCEVEKPFIIEEVKETLANYENLILLDDNKNEKYPTSTIANGNDLVYVGRVRKDLSCDKGILMYCTSDNIRKGAAANAVQIALKMLENNML